ncbi:hypothetical protein NDU88_006054 [Pleurodeles waltl]|uniref:Uncharacterized protein n=1 Tax=Pleurodeles waltl TaxID=8319 RepID=A0AAV7PKD8_PLEWA|nr:hypothetical protein NDU88_006054 [Pleurodeles waltl]
MESHKEPSYLPKRAVALAIFIVDAAEPQTLRPVESSRLLSLSGGEMEDGEVAWALRAAKITTESSGGSERKKSGSFSGGRYFFCSLDGAGLVTAGVRKTSIAGSRRPGTRGSNGLAADCC